MNMHKIVTCWFTAIELKKNIYGKIHKWIDPQITSIHSMYYIDCFILFVCENVHWMLELKNKITSTTKWVCLAIEYFLFISENTQIPYEQYSIECAHIYTYIQRIMSQWTNIFPLLFECHWKIDRWDAHGVATHFNVTKAISLFLHFGICHCLIYSLFLIVHFLLVWLIRFSVEL